MKPSGGFQAEIALVVMAPQIASQLAPCEEDSIAENHTGEWAERGFHKPATAADDLTGRLCQALHAVSLMSLDVEEDGTTLEVFQVHPFSQAHLTKGFDDLRI